MLNPFHNDIDLTARNVTALAATVRALRTDLGQVRVVDVIKLQSQFRAAHLAALQVLRRAAQMDDPAPMEAHMAAIGGPASLADFQTAFGAIQAAAASWNALLDVTISGLAGGGLQLVPEGTGDEQTHILKRVEHLPATESAALRGADELLALQTALEAVGA